jgi:hypothetical protein
MTTAWILIFVLLVATVAIKSAGPLALGHRELPPRAMAVISMLAPAILAGLVLYETFGTESTGIQADARVFGLAAAGGAIAVRLPLLAVVIIAAAATAVARAIH